MAKNTSKNPIILRVDVEGSGGKKYIVSQRADGNWACSCPGWKFCSPRRDCKHIRATKAVNKVIWQVKPSGSQLQLAFIHRPVVGGLRT